MEKLSDNLNKQLTTEFKEDAIACLKIYTKLKELNDGRSLFYGTKQTAMNRHISKRLRVVIVAALTLAGSLLSSCNKYELLEGCTYRNDIGASKPVRLKIGNQKQTVFITNATYYLPEGTKIHFKALHGDTEVRINNLRFTLKRKGDEVWYITRAQHVWDKGHPNDWLDPRKHTKIQDHVTGNFTMD